MENQDNNTKNKFSPTNGETSIESSHNILTIGVASQIGFYSDAILTKPSHQLLITSGTPGLSPAGDLPQDFKGQAELAWKNVITLLDDAGMTIGDIVKVTQYLINPEHIKEYGNIRKQFLGDLKPASMLLVISQLVWPEMLIEIEVIAAKPI